MRGGARRDRRTRASRAEGADARTALLAAAAEVFAQRGYSGASMDEIAERAGYSKGALYWHFDSKDELFFALMDQSVDGPAHEMIELLHAAPPEQDMAPEASRRMAELVSGQRELLLLDHECWAQAVRDPELAAGLANERLIDPDAVPDQLLGRVIVLMYRGLLASAGEPGETGRLPARGNGS
jgi:AcrR family transcriptional regulator